MDPEAEARFNRIEQKLEVVSDLILSLGRTSSEHDGRLSRLEEIVAALSRSVGDHDGKIHAHDATFDRVAGLLAAFAEGFRELQETDRQFRTDLAQLRAAQAKTDEHLDVLIRMMDEWIRRQPPDGKGA